MREGVMERVSDGARDGGTGAGRQSCREGRREEGLEKERRGGVEDGGRGDDMNDGRMIARFCPINNTQPSCSEPPLISTSCLLVIVH